MLKKPITTSELFYRICQGLNGIPLEVMVVETNHPREIMNPAFSLHSELGYGEMGGIDLHTWIDGVSGRKPLGMFHIDDASDEAMHVMASLLADWLIKGHKYINSHIDDFDWEGVSIYITTDKMENMYYTKVRTNDDAMAIVQELSDKYTEVILRDNRTRKIKTFVNMFTCCERAF